MKEIKDMSFEELANEISTLEHSLREQLVAKESVDIERNHIATEILTLKLKDHDLKDAQIKANANCRRLMLAKDQLRRIYWERKSP